MSKNILVYNNYCLFIVWVLDLSVCLYVCMYVCSWLTFIPNYISIQMYSALATIGPHYVIQQQIIFLYIFDCFLESYLLQKTIYLFINY